MQHALKNISILTAHFHDFRWTELLLRKLRETTAPGLIGEILIINQDRTASSHDRLAQLDPRVRVVQYPREETLFQLLGHDHPAVLNKVINEAQGDWICLFDSDAHPLHDGWLSRCSELLESHDAILAEDPRLPGLTHPCFMIFARNCVNLPLLFDEGLLATQGNHRPVAERIDTGRMIGRQMARAGRRVHLAKSAAAFDGLWGSVYLDCIYHHGSGSFKGGERLLGSQVTWRHNFFEEAVLNHNQYQLRGFARHAYRCRAAIWNLRNKAATALHFQNRATASPA